GSCGSRAGRSTGGTDGAAAGRAGGGATGGAGGGVASVWTRARVSRTASSAAPVREPSLAASSAVSRTLPASSRVRASSALREAVGTHHGAEDARALIAGEPRAILPAVPRERHPQVATPTAGVPDRLEHPRPDAGPIDRVAPCHLPQRRTHEELEGHHRRHR